MSCLSRTIALPLVLLILVVTPCAFWTFNISRVALNPQTYKTALNNQNFYNNVLPALVDATSVDNPNSEFKAAARGLIDTMSPEDWSVVADKVLPPNWLREQIDGNIDRFFEWVNAERPALEIGFDLSVLKTRLTGDAGQSAAAIIVPKLPPCTPDQESFIQSASQSDLINKFPFCRPESDSLQQNTVQTLTAIFAGIGQSLPSQWNLMEQIRKENAGPESQHVNEFQIGQFRALLWVLPRMLAMLFLIPIALLSIIVMVLIRSGKQFFRWTGWILILSGLITLTPIPLVPAMALGMVHNNRPNIEAGFGSSGFLLFNLIQGMMNSIMAGLTLAVLTQVAVVIVVGFIAVFLSMFLRAPEPDVTHQELAAERFGQMASMMGSTPRPFGSTVTPAGLSTLGGQITPPATPPPAPDPLADIFNDQ